LCTILEKDEKPDFEDEGSRKKTVARRNATTTNDTNDEVDVVVNVDYYVFSQYFSLVDIDRSRIA
jgi:hypothetical protein